MPIIYSYSGSGRSREGDGNQNSSSRSGMSSRSASTRSMYVGGNRNGSTSRGGVNSSRRNSSSVVEGGVGADSVDEPEPTDADDSIFLSDLVRTGEASRLRRRGAMRIDHHHSSRGTGDGPTGTSAPQNNGTPSRSGTRAGNLGIGRRYSSYRASDYSSPVTGLFNTSINPGLRSGSIRLDTPSTRTDSDGDGWIAPTPLRRTSANLDSSRSPSDSPDHERESYTYTLFCGYEPEPGTGEYAAQMESWAEEEFMRKQMCREAFQPSAFPDSHSPPSSSTKGKSKAMSSPRVMSNGCGALIHLHAAPRSRMGVWMAKAAASDAVVTMDPDYFLDSVSRSGSRNGSSRSGSSAMVKVNIVKSACGCIREGVGCAACGNPLGTRYKPCQTAADSIFSNSRNSRPRTAPDGVDGTGANMTLTSGDTPGSSSIAARPEGPHGPAYWRPEMVHPHQTQNQPSKSSDQPYYIYTFFSGAVTSSPGFSFPSSQSNAGSTTPSRPSTSRNMSDVSVFSMDTVSSATTRPALDARRSSGIVPGVTTVSSHLSAPSSYVLIPPSTPTSTSTITPVTISTSNSPSPSSGVTAASSVSVSGSDGFPIVPNSFVPGERRNRASTTSLASTVTVFSVGDPDIDQDVVGGEAVRDEQRTTASSVTHDITAERASSLDSDMSAEGEEIPTSPTVVPDAGSDSAMTPTPPLSSLHPFEPTVPVFPFGDNESVLDREEGALVGENRPARQGRFLPRRQSRIGEDEAEEALRMEYRGYEDGILGGMLSHTLIGEPTQIDQGEGETSENSYVPLPMSDIQLDSLEVESRQGREGTGGLGEQGTENERPIDVADVDVAGTAENAVESTMLSTPVSAAAVESIPLEFGLESTLTLPTDSMISMSIIADTDTVSPSHTFPSEEEPEAGDDAANPHELESSGGEFLTAPGQSISEAVEVLDREPGTLEARSENAQSSTQAREGGSTRTPGVGIDRADTQHMLALIRRAREQAQERREGMLDLLMGPGPQTTTSSANFNVIPTSLSAPSSPSSSFSTSSLPPLIFPPTPSSSLPSLVPSPTSPLRVTDRISRLSDIIRNARAVAEPSGERQREWSAFEEWMSREETQSRQTRTTPGDEGNVLEAEPVTNEENFDFDSDTESENEGRIILRTLPSDNWVYRGSYGMSGRLTGNARNTGVARREADEEDDDDDTWGRWSMPPLQDVSDSDEDDVGPAPWDDSTDEDEDATGDNAEADVDARDQPQTTNTVFDPDGELLDSMELQPEDSDKQGEVDRARMGVRVPTNVVAGR